MSTVSSDVSIASVERRFQELAEEWKQAATLVSSTTRIAMHPSYQRIIGLGEPAVPLILEDLEREPAEWF